MFLLFFHLSQPPNLFRTTINKVSHNIGLGSAQNLHRIISSNERMHTVSGHTMVLLQVWKHRRTSTDHSCLRKVRDICHPSLYPLLRGWCCYFTGGVDAWFSSRKIVENVVWGWGFLAQTPQTVFELVTRLLLHFWYVCCRLVGYIRYRIRELEKARHVYLFLVSSFLFGLFSLCASLTTASNLRFPVKLIK